MYVRKTIATVVQKVTADFDTPQRLLEDIEGDGWTIERSAVTTGGAEPLKDRKSASRDNQPRLRIRMTLCRYQTSSKCPHALVEGIDDLKLVLGRRFEIVDATVVVAHKTGGLGMFSADVPEDDVLNGAIW